MALPIRRLFVDFDTGQVYRNFNDLSPTPAIYFTKGDSVKFDVVLVRQTGTPEFPMESIPMTNAGYGTSTLKIGDMSTTVASTSTSTDIPQPSVTVGSTVGSFFTFSIDSTPSYGSFTLTFTKSSPAISVTTKPIAFPFTTSDVSTAVKNAINTASGWTFATAEVVPTGPLSGQIRVTAIYSSTTYDLALSSTTMTSSSSLYGFVGLRFSIADSSGAVASYLGSETSKAALLEFVGKSTETQCIAQFPVIVRDTVG